MKLSKFTIEILKNFASINQGIIFKPGNKIQTMNIMKNTFVTAIISDEIPKEFAIYDLNEFLGCYLIESDNDLAFGDSCLTMNLSNGETTTYIYSSPSVVVSPGDKTIKLPSEDKKFILTKEVFDKILKMSGVLKLKDIIIDCDGIKIVNRNVAGNQHRIKLNVDCSKENSNPSLLKVENLKLIPVDYDVSICEKGLARFTSRNEDYKIEYHISLEVE